MRKRRPSLHLIVDVEYVECPYCGEPFKMLHWQHLKIHNKTIQDVRKEYPDHPTMTLTESNRRSKARLKCNDKINKTCNKKYGGVGFASSELKDKTVDSIQDKYGVDNCMKVDDIALRMGSKLTKEANPERAKKISKSLKGWNNPNKGKTYKEIYGEEKAKELIENRRISGVKGMTMTPKISAPQKELYEKVKKYYPNAKMEFPFAYIFCLDIAIEELKLCIEYDGSYWHDEEKDAERDETLKKLGWDTIRFIDYVPNDNELIMKIDEILNKRKK